MTVYVNFPHDLVAVPLYSGYYWHIYDQKLYSCKSGTLKELKLVKASRWTHGEDAYRVSRYGSGHYLWVSRLKKLEKKKTTIDYGDVDDLRHYDKN